VTEQPVDETAEQTSLLSNSAVMAAGTTVSRFSGFVRAALLYALPGFILAAVAFATWQDTTIRNGEDLRRLTSAPLLDAIPRLPAARAPDGGSRRSAGVMSTPHKSAGQLEESATVYPSTMGPVE